FSLTHMVIPVLITGLAVLENYVYLIMKWELTAMHCLMACMVASTFLPAGVLPVFPILFLYRWSRHTGRNLSRDALRRAMISSSARPLLMPVPSGSRRSVLLTRKS